MGYGASPRYGRGRQRTRAFTRPITRPTVPVRHVPPWTPGHVASHNARSWVLMAYLGQFFVGFAAPGIVYVLRLRSPFVRAHAAQALNVSIAITVVWVAGWFLSGTDTAWLWLPVGYMPACVAFVIKAAMAANQGEWYRIPLPFAWRLVK